MTFIFCALEVVHKKSTKVFNHILAEAQYYLQSEFEKNTFEMQCRIAQNAIHSCKHV